MMTWRTISLLALALAFIFLVPIPPVTGGIAAGLLRTMNEENLTQMELLRVEE